MCYRMGGNISIRVPPLMHIPADILWAQVYFIVVEHVQE